MWLLPLGSHTCHGLKLDEKGNMGLSQKKITWFTIPVRLKKPCYPPLPHKLNRRGVTWLSHQILFISFHWIWQLKDEIRKLFPNAEHSLYNLIVDKHLPLRLGTKRSSEIRKNDSSFGEATLGIFLYLHSHVPWPLSAPHLWRCRISRSTPGISAALAKRTSNLHRPARQQSLVVDGHKMGIWPI